MFPILNPAPTSLPYHPSGSSQCTSPNLPISCIDPRLAIRFLYDIIHVLMPFSYIIPPPSPTESKRLFYKSVSLLLSRIHMSTCCVILFSSLNYHQHKSTHFISSYFSFSTFFWFFTQLFSCSTTFSSSSFYSFSFSFCLSPFLFSSSLPHPSLFLLSLKARSALILTKDTSITRNTN